MTYRLETKETFLDQLLALPHGIAGQVNDKIKHVLLVDPLPDGTSKKPLKKYGGKVCRLRCGDYRAYYRYGTSTVQLLKVVIRRDAYEDDDDVDLSGELDLEDLEEPIQRIAPDWERQPAVEPVRLRETAACLATHQDEGGGIGVQTW